MNSSRIASAPLLSDRPSRRARRIGNRTLAVLAVAATLSLGMAPALDAVAQSLPTPVSNPAPASSSSVVELDAALLVPLFHALAETPAPAAIDATAVQILSARGAAALLTGPYRLRVFLQASAGSDGLLLEPEPGAPELQSTVQDIIYVLQITNPVTRLLVPEAIAVSLGEQLVASRATSVDLIIQIDRVEEADDSRRLMHATVRQAIVLGIVDAAPVYVIEVSHPAAVAETAAPPPLQTPAPAPVSTPVPTPPALPAAMPTPAPVVASETTAVPAPAAAPTPTPTPIPAPPPVAEATPTPPAPLPVAPTEPMGPPLMERIDAPMIVVAGGEVRASPQPSGALLFVVSPGTSLFVTGRVSDAWMQLRLIDGKLAYVVAEAFTATPVVNPLPATSNLAGNATAAPAAASPALAGTGQAAQAPAPLAPVAPFPAPAPSLATGIPAPTIPPVASAPAASAGQTADAPAPIAPATPPAPTPPAALPPTPAAPVVAPLVVPAPQQEALAEPVFVAERAGVLRNAASARALQVAQVRAGQRFTLLKEQRAGDGQIWAEVKPLDGAPGFLLRKDLVAAEEWDTPVSGAVTRVVDAATLVFGTRTIRLGAIEAGPVRFVEIVRPWLTGAASPLTCERRPDAAFDCFSADRRDVGETMILNGLARAGAGAPAYYLEAQDKAKQAKKGLWRTAR